MEYKFLKSLLPELVSKNNGIDNLWKHDLPKDLDIEILTSVDILGGTFNASERVYIKVANSNGTHFFHK